MKIIFHKISFDEAVQSLKEDLSQRKLPAKVEIVSQKENITILIKKAGESFLEFEKVQDKPCILLLKKEKIALTHRLFKKEVLNEIRDIIEKLDGELVQV